MRLQQEQLEIDNAIRALEFLATGKPRRGRPPKGLAALVQPGRKGKRKGKTSRTAPGASIG